MEASRGNAAAICERLLWDLIDDIADVCQQANSRFDRQRFHSAAPARHDPSHGGLVHD